MEVINGYWGGYFDSPITLNKVPNYYNVITLAFAGPDKKNSITTDFLCSRYSKKQIIEWMKELRKQNKNCKILLSIIDNPTYHWNIIQKFLFSNNVSILINDWDFDGIDIDGESGMPSDNFVDNFVDLTKNLRKCLGKDKIITYTCYEGTQSNDGKILKEIKDDIQWINTMAYFDDFESMKQLYNDYKLIMNDNICIGVKAGSKDDSSVTPLSEVQQLCKFNSQKKGMMLWTTNRDTLSFTGMQDNTWGDLIYNSSKLKLN